MRISDWSSDVCSSDLANYALFIYNKDAYGSTGRKLLQFTAALGGVSVKSGEHAGYAGLVDLKTGDLLWLNADGAMGGDGREVDGAERRVRQLLEGFPGDRKSVVSGQDVSVRVELGCARIIKKK